MVSMVSLVSIKVRPPGQLVVTPPPERHKLLTQGAINDSHRTAMIKESVGLVVGLATVVVAIHS